MNVSAGGFVEFFDFSSGGTVNVSSGGTVDFQTISSGGTLKVLAGGTDRDFEVASGGTLVVFGVANTASGFSNVDVGGHEIISSGGTGTGGGEIVSGNLAGTGVNGTVDVLSGGSFSYSTDFGGVTNLSAGATGHNLAAQGGGILNVFGTVTSNLWAYAGGTINVSSGGVVNGTSAADTSICGRHGEREYRRQTGLCGDVFRHPERVLRRCGA